MSQGQIESASPWDILSVDVMGLFMSSRKGERYIFIYYLSFQQIFDFDASKISYCLNGQ